MVRNTRPRKQCCKEDGHLSEPSAHQAQLQCCCSAVLWESSGWRKESCAWHSEQGGLVTQMLPCGRDWDTCQAFGYPQQTLLLWAAVYLAQKAQELTDKNQAAPGHCMQMPLPLEV